MLCPIEHVFALTLQKLTETYEIKIMNYSTVIYRCGWKKKRQCIWMICLFKKKTLNKQIILVFYEK